MIELMDWIRSVSLPPKPWLILGKGPSFSQRSEFNLGAFNLLSLNHVVRQQKVDVAHIIDLDVVEDCGESLLHNCQWLLMPRRPHVHFAPSQVFLLEDFIQASPILRELDSQGRLVWYNLSSGEPVGNSPVIDVRDFGSEAAFNLLAQLGVKIVRSLGIDGGRGYSSAFNDLETKTHLAAGHSSFDSQFTEMLQTAHKHGMDYAALVEPLRVFVGTDESSMMGTRLLEYSIRKYATQPVEVVPMLNVPVPLPRDPANRPRTGFSFSRFLIPALCNYRGRALYLDSDMQVFADLAELWRIPFGQNKVLCTNQPQPPEVWKDNPAFHAGRQMSVMLLDCSRLDWDINEIVRGLDEGRYNYQQLMFDLCLVPQDEITDSIPPEWNCLENYEDGKTKLLHYTHVPTQPWKSDTNPLREIWLACYREAIQDGAIAETEVLKYLQAGFVTPDLVNYFHEARAPKTRPRLIANHGTTPAQRLAAIELAIRGDRERRDAVERHLRTTQQQIEHQLLQAQAELAALRNSWSWKLGRTLTRPVHLLRHAWRRPVLGKTA